MSWVLCLLLLLAGCGGGEDAGCVPSAQYAEQGNALHSESPDGVGTCVAPLVEE
jgi:hypothetical protein